MSNFFTGDIEYILTDGINEETPYDFGCSSNEWTLFDVYTEDMENIENGIKKYKNILLELGVNPEGMSSNELYALSIKEVQSKWQLSEDNANKAYNTLYAYCMGLDILMCVKENGSCHFHLPA